MNPICIIRHVDYKRLGWIPELLDELSLPYLHVSLSLGEPFPDLSDLSGVISMGGPMSAYNHDQYTWIDDEMAFTREAVKSGLPYLGICLGGQILAQTFGAAVTPGELELGWLPLEKTAECSDDPVFGDLHIPELFQLHGDVFELPEGAVRLLQSTVCPNQAFSLAPKAYGLQFHPEANAEMLESVVEEYQLKLSEEQLVQLKDEDGRKAQAGRACLKTILQRLFLKEA